MLTAGFAQLDITPPAGGNMPGYFVARVAGEEVNSRLTVTAAAFSAEGGDVIFVSADVLAFTAQNVQAMRARIADKTGVAPSHILIAATHTHTGPAMDVPVYLCPPDEKTSAHTAACVEKAAVEAFSARRPAELGVTHFEEDRFSFNRDIVMRDGSIKMNPSRAKSLDDMVKWAGKVDYSVDVMRVEDETGRVAAFLVNYANHPDCHRRDNRKYSADYIGFLRRALKEEYGEDVCVLFFNGTCGDVNCIDYMHGESDWYYLENQAPQIIGAELAKDIIARSGEFVMQGEEPVIAVRNATFTTSRRRVSQAEREWAVEVQKDPNAYPLSDQAFAAEYAAPDDAPDTVEVEVQLVRLGPWSIVALPSEIFTEIGLIIKAASPYPRTLVFALANGVHGYIAPRYRAERPCYELRLSRYTYTGPETAEKLIETSARLLREQFFGEY